MYPFHRGAEEPSTVLAAEGFVFVSLVSPFRVRCWSSVRVCFTGCTGFSVSGRSLAAAVKIPSFEL